MSALLNIALPYIEPNTIWLEFGVAEGNSIRELAKAAPLIYGFDSFEGLPEDWRDENGGLQEPKGKFRCAQPTVPDNVIIVPGLFENTLPKWIANWNVGLLGFVHIDCDLYSSTMFVLDQLEPYLSKVVIAFDEIGPFPAGAYHEGRAFAEFMSRGKYRAQDLGKQHSAGAIYKLWTS